MFKVKALGVTSALLTGKPGFDQLSQMEYAVTIAQHTIVNESTRIIRLDFEDAETDASVSAARHLALLALIAQVPPWAMAPYPLRRRNGVQTVQYPITTTRSIFEARLLARL